MYCRPSLHTDCTSNLIVSRNFLTSGYKSGQDVAKPNSKLFKIEDSNLTRSVYVTLLNNVYTTDL